MEKGVLTFSLSPSTDDTGQIILVVEAMIWEADWSNLRRKSTIENIFKSQAKHMNQTHKENIFERCSC